MSERKTLTLRPIPFVDAAKIRKTEELGLRFISRKGRYMLQARVVLYPEKGDAFGRAFGDVFGKPPREPYSAAEHTWVDIPLVPEVYA